MNVLLTHELDTFVQQKVQTGMYHSASDVIRDGLRLLKEQDRNGRAGLRRRHVKTDVGTNQVANDTCTQFSPEMLVQLAAATTPNARRLIVDEWYDKHSKYKTPEERIKAMDALAEAWKGTPHVPDSAFDRDTIYDDKL